MLATQPDIFPLFWKVGDETDDVLVHHQKTKVNSGKGGHLDSLPTSTLSWTDSSGCLQVSWIMEVRDSGVFWMVGRGWSLG